MTEPLPTPQTYPVLLTTLKTRIRDTRLRTAVNVNRELILLYWDIGRDILLRQSAEGWGTPVIDRLARDLPRDFPDMTGLSPPNLKYMRPFAEARPDRTIAQQLVAQLPWGHNIRLLDALKQTEERIWYASRAIQHGWRQAVLAHQIEAGLIERAGKAPTNFVQTLPSPQSDLAHELLRDPYGFGVLAAAAHIPERELERGLLDNLRQLLLEPGKGFSFVASQYHLEIGEQDFYLDLLF